MTVRLEPTSFDSLGGNGDIEWCLSQKPALSIWDDRSGKDAGDFWTKSRYGQQMDCTSIYMRRFEMLVGDADDGTAQVRSAGKRRQGCRQSQMPWKGWITSSPCARLT